ncbi:MAG: ribosome recycling factor [Anaerolineales bacterium]
MIKDALQETEVRMKAAVQAIKDDLSRIRTGRASPALVEKLPVKYYGVPTPLVQLASISVPNPRSLLIRPFDPSTLKDIERAILASDLSLTPNNDGKNIHLNLPVLTQERRKELVRVVSGRVENGRVSVRNVRRDVIRDLREFESEKMISEDERRRGDDKIQKLADKYIEEMNKIGEDKKKEIMEI